MIEARQLDWAFGLFVGAVLDWSWEFFDFNETNGPLVFAFDLLLLELLVV